MAVKKKTAIVGPSENIEAYDSDDNVKDPSKAGSSTSVPRRSSARRAINTGRRITIDVTSLEMFPCGDIGMNKVTIIMARNRRCMVFDVLTGPCHLVPSLVTPSSMNDD